jgi:hypothetical protein
MRGGNAATSKPEVQAAFAKRLEEVLYKASKSIEEYSNQRTLDQRLQTILGRMQKRKATKTSPVAAKATAVAAAAAKNPVSAAKTVEQQKRDVLVRLLGRARMTQVFKIVTEIKLIQLGREVTEGKPFKPIKKCTSSGCSFSVPVPGDQKVPQVVRDLFFNTAIVAALEKTNPERLADLPWDELISQGQYRLRAYHDWYQERQAAKNNS